MDPKISTANAADTFVGIKVNKEGALEVIFPYGANIDSLTIKENGLAKTRILSQRVLKLIKTIKCAKIFYKEEANIKEGGFETKEDFPLYDFVWILGDYIDNGVYKTKEKKYTKSALGKINWKKTLRGDFIIHENNIIYNHLIYDYRVRADDEITNIHSYCINEANKLCGWLFGDIKIPERQKIPIVQKRALAILTKRLENTFDDRTKLLLNKMINILLASNANDSSNKILEYGTNKYQDVWEFTIRKIFNNTNREDFYATAIYKTIDNIEKNAKGTLKPDTVIFKGEDILVLDAKYYKYGINGDNNDLPPTSDINKQITYGEYAEKISSKIYGKTKNIFNAFIMPFDKSKSNNTNEVIQLAGYARGDWVKADDKSTYKKIAVLLIDTNYVLNAFSQYTKDDVIDDLIEKTKKIGNLN